MRNVAICLGFLSAIVAPPTLAQDRIFKCANEYTNSVSLAGANNCREIAHTPPASSRAQAVEVVNAPRTFNITAPPNWVPGPLETGNTRVAFTSRKTTPHAECAVTAIIFRGERATQEQLNASLKNSPSKEEAKVGLQGYNNVKVVSVSKGQLSGYPSQVIKFTFSVGTPEGERWGVMTSSTTVTEPNVSWAVGCGGFGKTLTDAQASYSYWQVEINNFPTTLKIR